MLQCVERGTRVCVKEMKSIIHKIQRSEYCKTVHVNIDCENSHNKNTGKTVYITGVEFVITFPTHYTCVSHMLRHGINMRKENCRPEKKLNKERDMR